jgi:hypothetical protein
MAESPHEAFSRIHRRLDTLIMQRSVVVIVGAGTVGSQIARELIRSALGRLVLIDGKHLQTNNLARHVLPQQYVGWNKAEALADHLTQTVPNAHVVPIPHHVSDSHTDGQLDRWLDCADLIIVATDEREAQRRVARRCLALDIPTLVPALYQGNGGEIFLQIGPTAPCFFCWDGFRDNALELREVDAVNVEAWPVVQHTVELSFAVLDPDSAFAELLASPPGDLRPRQIFSFSRFAPVAIGPARRRPACPSCAVGPPTPAPTASAGLAQGLRDSRAGPVRLLRRLSYILVACCIVIAAAAIAPKVIRDVTDTETPAYPTNVEVPAGLADDVDLTIFAGRRMTNDGCSYVADPKFVSDAVSQLEFLCDASAAQNNPDRGTGAIFQDASHEYFNLMYPNRCERPTQPEPTFICAFHQGSLGLSVSASTLPRARALLQRLVDNVAALHAVAPEQAAPPAPVPLPDKLALKCETPGDNVCDPLYVSASRVFDLRVVLLGASVSRLSRLHDAGYRYSLVDNFGQEAEITTGGDASGDHLYSSVADNRSPAGSPANSFAVTRPGEVSQYGTSRMNYGVWKITFRIMYKEEVVRSARLVTRIICDRDDARVYLGSIRCVK